MTDVGTILLRVALVAAVLLAGCGGPDASGSSGVAPTMSPVGIWTVSTYDGVAAPPYSTLRNQSQPVEVTADTLFVFVNGSFARSYTARETIGGVVFVDNLRRNGTWTKTTPVTFAYRFDGEIQSYNAAIEYDQLRTTADGHDYLYKLSISPTP